MRPFLPLEIHSLAVISFQPGHEEVWTAIEGTSLAWMGTELRLQRPGMAFMLRPDGLMLHSNVNYGDSQIKFLFFARSKDHAVRK